ncbi:MAG: stage V sporulation protein B [Peptococcaceae bacterium]|nr:stage V sporulation protein B [Peptococcaceae bacterium]
MSTQSFVYGTFVLLSASVFNRIIGFIYQIFMMRLIKPEGVGLFSMIFPIYIMMLVIASMGIPVAVSKLVACEVARNNLAGAYRIFRISLAVIAAGSLTLTCTLFAAAPLLARYLFPNPDIYPCFICIIPAIFIVSLCSAFRGFFQGLQRMSPTAVTQAAEQLVRVTAGLTIAWLLLPRGIPFASVGISLGVVCGELAGFLIMIYIFLTRRPRVRPPLPPALPADPVPRTLGRIFSLGVPVTLTRFISTALMSLDALIIPKRLLLSGMSMGEATSVFGQFVGIAEVLLFTPGVVTISLATALIPAVSEAQAQGKTGLVQSRIQEAVRITVLLGALLAAVFLVLPHNLCQVLFGYGSAGDALFIMAVSSPFLYLQQTTTGILQGLGRADIPFKNLLMASVVKILGIYYLTSIPGFGIRGTAVSLGAMYIIMSMMNYRNLKKITGLNINAAVCIYKPAMSAAAAALVMLQVRLLLAPLSPPEPAGLFLNLSAGVLAYLLTLYVIGGINDADIRRVKLFLKR